VHLSATDTQFLMQERDGGHLHFGAVAIFDGPAPEHEEFKAHISERLGLAPRFRQKLVFSPLPFDRPWWVEDPQFNLDYHVRRSGLPRPGDDAQLKRLVARLFSQRLDRTKPLWEMWLVEGLEEGRFALITKAHHALVDGVSGVDLASVILDHEPHPALDTSALAPFELLPAPTPAELVSRGLSEAAKVPLALAQQAAKAAFYPGQIGHTVTRAGRAVASLGMEFTDPAPRVPLNGPIGPHRRYEYRNLPLAEFRAIKDAHEATVNDVVLAVVTGALREWLLARRIPVEGLSLRALVPVNLRTEQERGLFGNRVAMLRTSLPVYAEDPEERLIVVRDQIRAAKRSRQLLAAKTIIGLGAFAPPTILGQASRLNFSTRLFNLLVTNVPGPQTPLYLLRRRLQSIAPVAFLPRGHALSVAVFSYGGLLSFGLLGEYDRMYDLPLIAGALEDSLRDLGGISGASARARSGARPRRAPRART